jgi:hypothetical protein
MARGEKTESRKAQVEHVIAGMDFVYILMVLKVITAGARNG